MRYILIFQLSLCLLHGYSQNYITLAEAEAQLQKNNLLLLANQYNISASKALAIQAKIWEQPYLSTELNAINPQDNRVFDVGNRGQKVLAVQQLIYLGGKKQLEINFAKKNIELATLEFEQLLGNLKYRLHHTFYNLYFDLQKIKSLDTQIAIIDTLVTNYSTQARKDNIPLKEVVRLQSLVLNLKNEKTNLLKDILESQQNISLLTGISETIEPSVNEKETLTKFTQTFISKDSMMAWSLERNIEYLNALKNMEARETYLKWQRSLAVPDLTTGISYDQRGGAFQNQINLTLGIPLPFWNKNKGNIKMAEAQLNQSNVMKEFIKLDVQTKSATFWQHWQQQVNQFKNIDQTTTENLALVFDGMVSNFQKRNITMLEFTDFMDSYNQSVIQLNEIKKGLILSGINLNYITRKEIF